MAPCWGSSQMSGLPKDADKIASGRKALAYAERAVAAADKAVKPDPKNDDA